MTSLLRDADRLKRRVYETLEIACSGQDVCRTTTGTRLIEAP